MPVPVRTTVVLDCIGVTVSNNRLYQRKVDVDMLNTIKNVLADTVFQLLALCPFVIALMKANTQNIS